MMDINAIAHNLFKKHEGRYLIYDMEGKRYTLVDVSYKPYLSVAVYYRYSPEKHFYLNGEVLVPYDVYVDSIDDSCAVYFFRDLDLVRTNPGGTLYPDKVNYIEYK